MYFTDMYVNCGCLFFLTSTKLYFFHFIVRQHLNNDPTGWQRFDQSKLKMLVTLITPFNMKRRIQTNQMGCKPIFRFSGFASRFASPFGVLSLWGSVCNVKFVHLSMFAKYQFSTSLRSEHFALSPSQLRFAVTLLGCMTSFFMSRICLILSFLLCVYVLWLCR